LAATSAHQNAPALTARPPLTAPRPYAFPAVRRLSVAGGRILAADLPGQPIAWLSLLLDQGALREPDGLDGLARATAGLLDEGTAGHSADEFGTAVESLGGQWGVDTGWESVRISLDLPTDQAVAGARLVAEAVRTPGFTDTDVERYLTDLVAAKQESFARPGPRAQAALRGALYGPEHRFGRLAGGDPETAAAIDAEAVRAFHAAWLGEPGTLLVAGDLDRLDLEALGRTVFAGARTLSAAAPAVPAAVAAPNRLVIADRPDAVQSTLRIGHPIPTRAQAAAQGIDVVALRVASTILGGSFISRLNHELREVKGYTYGVHASFDLGSPAGLYSVSADVRTDSTAAAVADTLRVIEEFIDGGATAAELETTRAYLAGATPISLQTVGAVGHRLIEITRHSLPDDYVTTEHARLLDVTLDEVNAAVRAALRPADLVVAVEGDRAVVGADLEALGLG
jgi:zinc protease